MKKQLTVMLLMFVLLLTMAGCSTAHAVQKLDAAEEKVEAKLDMVEEKVEEKLEEALRKAPATAPTAPAAPAAEPTVPAAPTAPAVVPTEPAPAEGALITKEQAEKIALDHLGFTADQVSRMRTEYEIDDGIPQYDVEFLQGDWEYEFEIHAENGKILSYDKDHKYD